MLLQLVIMAVVQLYIFYLHIFFRQVYSCATLYFHILGFEGCSAKSHIKSTLISVLNNKR